VLNEANQYENSVAQNAVAEKYSSSELHHHLVHQKQIFDVAKKQIMIERM